MIREKGILSKPIINTGMKIQDILLEAKSEPIVAYHTTMLNHLKSLLKKGLVPNHSKDGYASNAHSSTGYTLAALPGVYFNKDAGDAEQLAKDFSTDENAEPMIVVCQVQPKTGSLDEDRLVSDVLRETLVYRRFKQLAKEGQLDDEAYRSYVQNILTNLKDTATPQALKNAAPHIYNYAKALGAFILENTPETEQDLKKSQEVLTFKLKSLLTNKDTKHTGNSFKVTEPVSFSGSNRIIGIYLPLQRSGWGKLGAFERDAYHKYKSPMEMLQVKS